MTTIPTDLRYSAQHEWVAQRADGRALIGVSAVATDALGELVYIELPAVGSTVTVDTVCGEIESTKSVSELYAPVSGTVVEVNDSVTDNPAILNDDPYGDGWLIVVAVTAEGALLSADEYARENGVDL
jgi:glycine cleavage system H protein